jgi:AAA family ATP:ADP antiporter
MANLRSTRPSPGHPDSRIMARCSPASVETQILATANVVLTPTERWLAALGVRPEDKEVTSLLFGNMFLAGLAISLTRVCAYTLFLKHFGSDKLALTAVLLAISGTLLTLILDASTRHRSVRAYIFTVLSIIIVGLVSFRFLLTGFDNKWLIFALPLWFEIVYMLFSLQFFALLSRLLHVRQTKRLAGLARSGEFLAEFVAGLAVVFLLNFMAVPDLLLIAALMAVGVGGIVYLTASRYQPDLHTSTQALADEGEAHDFKMLALLKLPYVKLISFCYGSYIFAYFFLDVAFFGYASAQFPDENALAAFFGQFFGFAGALTFVVMVLLFAPLMQRFGIFYGVVAFPIIIGAGCIAVSTMEFANVALMPIFIVMAGTQACRYLFQSAVWKPTVAILFQVLPDRQRTQGLSLTEGVIDPLSGGLAGISLFFLTDMLGLPPKIFLLLLAALMVVWVVVGVSIRRQYLSNLMLNLQKRKLGELSLNELDGPSLEIIKSGTRSEYPAEILYCLNLLEEVEHPEITELIKGVLANRRPEVRLDVLKRVERLAIEPLAPQIRERILLEDHPEVLGQALKTLAVVDPTSVITELQPFLEHERGEVRHGALVGILKSQPDNESAKDYLLALVRSSNPANRKLAAEVQGDTADATYSGFLVELLEDHDQNVVLTAINVAAKIRDPHLLNVLVSKLTSPALQPSASLALQQYGEEALYELDLGFTSPNATRQDRLHIVDIIREIGGVHAMQVLLRHIEIDKPEIRHQIYLSLALLHYQADDDDKYLYVNMLEEEILTIAWLLASINDLIGDPRFEQLTNALSNELEVRQDNMLLLISFLYSSIAMLDTRANLSSKVAELRIFALEVLDNILTAEIKQIVLPILDDLTEQERLDALAGRYPQEVMTSSERFDNIMEVYFADAFYWTRASLLYQIGREAVGRHTDLVKSALSDPEPVIRETAIWALSRMPPPGLRGTLAPYLHDFIDYVASAASEVIRDLPQDQGET